jgi:hypothetical protein
LVECIEVTADRFGNQLLFRTGGQRSFWHIGI